MADEQIRIDVTATDDASKVLTDVADDAEALERLTPEITVGADTDAADRQLKDLREDAEALSRQDAEIVLRARIDDAKGALKALRTDLEQTADKADDTSRRLDKVGDGAGMRTRGNAIADLTGPLGDASGAASDFAGVFEGIGDIAEDVAGKVGVNAATMSTAIGGIGIAVAAGAAAWAFFAQRQAEAKARLKELVDGQRELNAAIAEGNLREAAEQFSELYKGALDGADELGTSVGAITEYITGQSDALGPLIEAHDNYATAAGSAADAIQSARDDYLRANGTLADQDRVLRDVEQALSRSESASDRAAAAQLRHERATERTKGALDRMRGALNMEGALLSFQSAMADAMTGAEGEVTATADEILSLKQSILDVAEFAKLTPIEIATLLQRVDNGDLAGVAADVERHYANNRVPIATALRDISSYDAAEFRRRMTDAIGEVPVRGRLTTVRHGNTQIPV